MTNIVRSLVCRLLSWIATHTFLPIPTTWAYRFGAADLQRQDPPRGESRFATIEERLSRGVNNARKPLSIGFSDCPGFPNYSSPSPEEQHQLVTQAMKNMQQAVREAENGINKAREELLL